MSAERGRSSQPETQATCTKEGKKWRLSAKFPLQSSVLTLSCSHHPPSVFLCLPPPLLPPWNCVWENPRFSDTKNGFPWVPQTPAFTLRFTHFLLCVPLSHRVSTLPKYWSQALQRGGAVCILRRGLMQTHGQTADGHVCWNGIMTILHTPSLCTKPLHALTGRFHCLTAVADGVKQPSQDSNPYLTPKPRYVHPTFPRAPGAQGTWPPGISRLTLRGHGILHFFLKLEWREPPL